MKTTLLWVAIFARLYCPACVKHQPMNLGLLPRIHSCQPDTPKLRLLHHHVNLPFLLHWTQLDELNNYHGESSFGAIPKMNIPEIKLPNNTLSSLQPSEDKLF